MKKTLSVAGILLGACLVAFLLVGVFMPRLTYKIVFEVKKPVDLTFRTFMDAGLMGEWMTGFKKMETLSGRPGEIGSRYRFVFNEDGKDMFVDEEVIQMKENEVFAFSMDNEFLDGTGEFRFVEKNGATEVTYLNDTAGKNAVFRSLLALSRSRIKERNQKDFDKLKTLIESKNP